MIYIGSTCKTLQQRLKGHEAHYKLFKAGKYHNVLSFKILENKNYKIELVENYPCENKQQLNLREGQIIKEYKNNKLNIVNKYIAGQTNKESSAQYIQNNKDKIKESVAQYYQKNKTEINKQKSIKHNCACTGSYTATHKARHEKSKKHQDYINNSKTTNNTGNTYNITINVNSTKELKNLELEFLNAIKN